MLILSLMPIRVQANNEIKEPNIHGLEQIFDNKTLSNNPSAKAILLSSSEMARTKGAMTLSFANSDFLGWIHSERRVPYSTHPALAPTSPELYAFYQYLVFGNDGYF